MDTDRTLEGYLLELTAYPLLNAPQEWECARLIESGDESALDRLVRCNLRCVVAVARKYHQPGCSMSEIIDEGNLALVRAAHRFDAKRGVRFIHLALLAIQFAIFEETQLQTARLPRSAIRRMLRVVDAEQVGNRVDLAIGGDDDNRIDRLVSMVTSGLMETVNATLNALDEGQAEIIRWSLGLESGGPRTVGEIAFLRGCSESEVLHLKDQALWSLRHLPHPPAGHC